jgi:hypothetical protein
MGLLDIDVQALRKPIGLPGGICSESRVSLALSSIGNVGIESHTARHSCSLEPLR